jgi:hypothetical protein
MPRKLQSSIQPIEPPWVKERGGEGKEMRTTSSSTLAQPVLGSGWEATTMGSGTREEERRRGRGAVTQGGEEATIGSGATAAYDIGEERRRRGDTSPGRRRGDKRIESHCCGGEGDHNGRHGEVKSGGGRALCGRVRHEGG